MRGAFVNTLIEIAKKDKDVHLITGDLGYGILKPFWEQLPEQFTNAGVAEQNMTSFAAGMALQGKKVFTYSIGNFPTLRALEQIRNDCAYHNANVKIVSVGGGFAYGPLGMSHHATEDLAIMRALPNVVVLAPADPTEAKWATDAIYRNQGTCYLRLGKSGEQIIHNSLEEIRIGEAVRVEDGENVAIFSTGAIFDEILGTKEILRMNGIHPALFSFPTVKPIDYNLILKCSKLFKLIVTVEEHNIVGGFGSAVAEVLAELRERNARLLRIGINNQYSCIVGTQKYLRNAYGISADKIAETIMAEL